YIGADISMKSLQAAQKRSLPANWDRQLVRTSANIPLIKEGSLDLVFSAAALHHLQIDSVIGWISKALKPEGLFILTEPGNKNPFAQIGRRMVHGFHTEGEKPLDPVTTKRIAEKNDLVLMYERGLDCVNGPLSFFAGITKMPRPIVAVLYYFAHLVDRSIKSSKWSYRFVQIYKRKAS
ncbi:MAG: class I SAM-dependent methyltransferase, partial [Nitrososphaeraceae archaeon]